MNIRFYVTIFVIIATYFIYHFIYKKYKNNELFEDKQISFIPLVVIALETMLIGKWDLTAAICTMVICISVNYYFFICYTRSFLMGMIALIGVCLIAVGVGVILDTPQVVDSMNNTYGDRQVLRAEDRYITLDIDRNGDLYYLYLVETEEGIETKKSRTDETSIVEDNTNEAYIETEYADKIMRNNHLGGLEYTVRDKVNRYVIHLPKGTMK